MSIFANVFDALDRLASASRDYLDSIQPSTLAPDVVQAEQSRTFAELRYATDRAEALLRSIDEEDDCDDDGEDYADEDDEDDDTPLPPHAYGA